MEIALRTYQNDDDYWRIRAFLREVFVLNQRRELSWQTARLDYWRYFINEQFDHYALTEAIFLFETPDGKLAAVIAPDARGNAFLSVHPVYRTPELESAMLDVAEERLSECDDKGQRHLTVWAHQIDELRQQVLTERGYVKGGWPEYGRGRSLDAPIPEPVLPPGYTIRSLGDETDVRARAFLSWRVFHPDDPDEKYGGWEWYRYIQRCPMYRRDLDLVVVAPDGELAAFTTVWYDDVTRTGQFEPVGTSRDHRQRGLGKAIMREGMRRIQRLGAIHATVAGYSTEANALYASVMSPDYLLFERWQKTF